MEKTATERLTMKIFTRYTQNLTQTCETPYLCFGNRSDFSRLFTTLPPKSDMENLSRNLTEIDNFLLNTRNSFFLNEKSRYYNLSSKPSDDVVVKYEELCYINIG